MRRRLIVLTLLAVPFPVAAQEFRGRGSGEDVWKALATKYDRNKDGRISTEEYSRGKEKFQALDRNADGALTASDFVRQDPSGGIGPMFANRLVRAADTDGSGDVTSAEWKTFLASLEVDEAGVIDAAKLRSRLPMPGRGGRQMPSRMLQAIDRDSDGKLELVDLEALFVSLDRNKSGVIEASELGGRRERGTAPARGDLAPDFELAYARDTAKTVRLSSFAGKRPVALIFGSYT
jgi:Ca2+-binding EF-hand superfamily protein